MTTIATIPGVAFAPRASLTRSGIRNRRYTPIERNPMMAIVGIPPMFARIGDSSYIVLRRHGKIAAAMATTMNVRISAAPAVNNSSRNWLGPYTVSHRKISVISSTMPLAISGEWVRSFTSEIFAGRIRSNDHANRLLVAMRNVGGSATKKDRAKLIPITAIRNVFEVSIAANRKKNGGADSGY